MSWVQRLDGQEMQHYVSQFPDRSDALCGKLVYTSEWHRPHRARTNRCPACERLAQERMELLSKHLKPGWYEDGQSKCIHYFRSRPIGCPVEVVLKNTESMCGVWRQKDVLTPCKPTIAERCPQCVRNMIGFSGTKQRKAKRRGDVRIVRDREVGEASDSGNQESGS